MFFYKDIQAHFVAIFVSLFWVLFSNFAFFKHVLQVYPLSGGNSAFVVSLGVVLFSLIVALLLFLSSRFIFKPLILLLLFITSQSAYFMDSYDVVINSNMIQNLIETNPKEALDLFSLKQILYFVLLFLLPAFVVYRLKIKRDSLRDALIQRVKYIAIFLFIAIGSIYMFNKYYTSFFREHKSLRYYVNPVYYLYSAGNYIAQTYSSKDNTFKEIAQDVKIKSRDEHKIVILVVGETARWDHFSLNGYQRETNPLLREQGVINFDETYSCGTETAVSVPCMFSVFTRNSYDKKKVKHTQNLLDILQKAGVKVLWRDNNSDSKGVALRVEYEDFQNSDKNSICDIECRDEGMLVGLDDYIEANKNRDIVIVLHQMGNHGPAYYKRYPKEFEKFTPVCQSNQLESCSTTEIINAYDNAILYTDYFLSKSIDFLKKYENNYQVAMFYVSDHGESLGENGLYLHGFPYAIAPEVQKRVPAVLWFGDGFNVEKKSIDTKQAYSHDNYFHTVLRLLDIESSVYDESMSILK